LPLYEYRCRKCGTHVEKIRKFSDPPLSKCEKCGGKLERLLSSPAFQFKGAGFYATDYARKSSGESGSGPSGPADKSDKPAAGKNDGSAAKETKKPAESSSTGTSKK